MSVLDKIIPPCDAFRNVIFLFQLVRLLAWKVIFKSCFFFHFSFPLFQLKDRQDSWNIFTYITLFDCVKRRVYSSDCMYHAVSPSFHISNPTYHQMISNGKLPSLLSNLNLTSATGIIFYRQSQILLQPRYGSSRNGENNNSI